MEAIIQENNVITHIEVEDNILSEEEFEFLVDIISQNNIDNFKEIKINKFINYKNIKEL